MLTTSPGFHHILFLWHLQVESGQMEVFWVGPPKIGVVVFTPQIIHFSRVFHEINHPFWETPIFHQANDFPENSRGFPISLTIWGEGTPVRSL